MKYLTLDEVLLYVILGCIVAAVVGIGVGYLLRKRIAEARIGSAEEKAKQIADDTYIFLLKESDTKKLNIPIMHMLYTIISINCILRFSTPLVEERTTVPSDVIIKIVRLPLEQIFSKSIS